MKKLISLLAVALFINLTVAKAQSTTNTEPAAPVKKEVAAKDAKQCHAASAAQHSCGTEKASTSTTTLSEDHVNAGIAPAAEAKDKKASCDDAKGMKSCCKSSSRASAVTKDLKQANTSNAIAPKEADAPKQ